MKRRSAGFCLVIICFASLVAGASPRSQFFPTDGSRIRSRLQPNFSGDASRIREDNWFAEDKADHFFTSAMLSCSAYLALRTTHNGEPTAFVSSLTGSLTVGIVKEIWDVFHPGTPSWKDLTADLLGSLLGTASAYAMTAR